MAKQTQKSASTLARGKRNERVGVVINNKASNTISVEITRSIRHKRYGKFLKSHNRFLVHDTKSEAQIGDTVLIVETRPLSKNKRWKLVKVVQKAGDQGAQL